MKEIVSIIIPTYNRAKTLKKSIMSCLNQTYKNIEVIVVDDGSTDNTKEIVKSIKDNRLKYYSYKKNKGACYARNYGINKASGEYIAFNDSDDIYLPNKTEEQIYNMKKTKSDMDFSIVRMVLDKNNTINFPNESHIVSIKNGKYIDQLVNGNFISMITILVKKSVIAKYMFDEELPRWQDFDLVLRMIPDIKVSYSNKVLSEAFRSKNSISNNSELFNKTVKIMMNKKYNIDDNNMKVLHDMLLDAYLNNSINPLQAEIDDLNRRMNDKENSYNQLEKAYKELYKEKTRIDASYNDIINSKRWKLINKILGNKK